MTHHFINVSLLSILLCSTTTYADTTVTKCGEVYTSQPCEHGVPLQGKKLNKYKSSPNLSLYGAHEKSDTLHHNDSTSSNKPTKDHPPQAATSEAPNIVTISGNDVDRMLVQLKVKQCDKELEKSQPELCKKP